MSFTFIGNADPHISEAWRRTLMAEPCVYCGAEATGLDHIAPRSSFADVPGKRHLHIHGWWNRAPACGRCDMAKRDTPLLIFLVQIRADGLREPTDKMAARLERLRHRQRQLRGLRATW